MDLIPFISAANSSVIIPSLGFSGSGGGHVNDLRFRVYVRPAVFKFSDDVILNLISFF